MKYYWQIIFSQFWLSFKQGFYHPLSAFLFILAKIIRFFSFLAFFFLIFHKVKSIAGFSFYDLVFYYLVFTLVDTLSQLLGRGAYNFDAKVIDGSFDYDSVYPINGLFYNLFAYIDPLDLVTLPVFVAYFAYFVQRWYYWPDPAHLAAFLISILFSTLAILAIYILAMAVGFLSPMTGEVLWIWRNLSRLGRVPARIYPRQIYYFLLYFLPVVIIINYPAMVWQAKISWLDWAWSLVIEIFILFMSIFIWHLARHRYRSASS